MPSSDCLVSVVAPLSNDREVVQAFITEVMDVLRAHYRNYELVLVDDGSTDGTFEVVNEALTRYECIRLLRLSRKFGTEIAISAGLDAVIGDYVVVMLPSTDPPALIPEIVQKAQQGASVVYGVRSTNAGESFLIRIARAVFYWFSARTLGLRLVRNASYFRALSRQSVNALTQIKDKYRHLRLHSIAVGFASQSFTYKPLEREGRRKRQGFFELVNSSINLVVSNSAHPLRFISVVGALACVLNLLYVAYVIAINLFKKEVVEGWTTLSLQIAGMFSLVFIMLTILSEYTGRILDESRDRPLYYVLEERCSSVLLTQPERRNIVHGDGEIASSSGFQNAG